MNKQGFLATIIAVLLSLAGGFLLANALNRTELNSLKAENEQLKNDRRDESRSESESTLAAEEIQKRIAEADKNPTDIAFQKNLGTALYRYATIKKDVDLLNDVERLLNRVYQSDDKDYEAIVALGNIYFDLGFFRKENDKFVTAREFYQKALEQQPKDIDVRTDYGLTYFFETPPATEKAISEFQKSFKENPKHEKTLQALTEANLNQNKIEEAELYLAKLKEVNQNNPAITELSTKLNKNRSSRQ